MQLGIPYTSVSNRQTQVEPMAVDTSGGHSAMDYDEHKRTYAGFLRATMVVVGLLVVILLYLLTLVPKA
jgi:hypothetical protein